ncbi:MAG TPA: GNAT family N-acetyltransferase [Pyrinomonadaceae bacterium]|nr:GNAT family N-acetyltransferase [Pyrinomonadaceae bacterium]
MVIRTDSENEDFQELVRLLDEDLAIRDGADHSFYAQFNKIDAIKNVVVVYQNELPVGCGAFKKFDDETVEIKRMFVRPEYRGKGVAGIVLKELENWAGEAGFEFAVLETGKKQPEAIRLYEKSGYALIPNYGQYAGIENSICMKKSLNG